MQSKKVKVKLIKNCIDGRCEQCPYLYEDVNYCKRVIRDFVEDVSNIYDKEEDNSKE